LIDNGLALLGCGAKAINEHVHEGKDVSRLFEAHQVIAQGHADKERCGVGC
jgi:hypothetical protein